MHTTGSQNELQNCGTDEDVMMTIVKGEIKKVIAERADRAYAEHTEAEIQTRGKETLDGMSQLVNSAASNGIEMPLVRFLRTGVVRQLSRRAFEEVMPKCFERWAKPENLLVIV